MMNYLTPFHTGSRGIVYSIIYSSSITEIAKSEVKPYKHFTETKKNNKSNPSQAKAGTRGASSL